MGENENPESREIEFLRELIRIPSVTGEEQKIAGVIEEKFSSIGVKTVVEYVTPERPMVLGILETSVPGPVLVYNGHMDTHSIDNYIGDPFQAEMKEGKLYGRGAVDMKGGLSAMICALERLKNTGGLKKGMLIVAAVPDEEQLSQGTTWMVEYLKRKKIKADAGIVSEPTGLKIGYAMRGVSHIDIGVKGYPQHTSCQHNEGNAIIQMGKVLALYEKELTKRYARRKHPLLGTPVFNAGVIKGGEKPNVVAQDCVVTMLRRDLPGEILEEVLKELEEIAKLAVDPKCQVYVQESRIQQRPGKKKRLPMEVDENGKLVKVLKKSVFDATGKAAESGMVPFWCDASIMTNEGQIPTVVFGPGDINCAHSPEEWIDTWEYEKAIEIFVNFAKEYCNRL